MPELAPVLTDHALRIKPVATPPACTPWLPVNVPAALDVTVGTALFGWKPIKVPTLPLPSDKYPIPNILVPELLHSS